MKREEREGGGLLTVEVEMSSMADHRNWGMTHTPKSMDSQPEELSQREITNINMEVYFNRTDNVLEESKATSQLDAKYRS